MKSWVVFTMGTKLKETEDSMSWIVEADTLDEAKELVCHDEESGMLIDDLTPEDVREEYGHTWFLQQLNPMYTAACGSLVSDTSPKNG